jgi:hypothetical protein
LPATPEERTDLDRLRRRTRNVQLRTQMILLTLDYTPFPEGFRSAYGQKIALSTAHFHEPFARFF